MDTLAGIMLEIGLIVFVIWIIYKIYSGVCELREAKARIDTLARENSDLRMQITALTQEKTNTQVQMEALHHESHSLKAALAESERKLDFYMNIESASTDLNVPDTPAPTAQEVSDTQADEAQLDPEQSSILSEMESTQENFFITGKAGTGKSFLLEAFKKATRKKHIVIAPTGVAALNVGGTTLHRAFGYYNLVNLNVEDISEENIHLKSEKRIVLKHISTIIIDEISMVRADTFDKIDRILRVINRSNKPFGGKQLLLFGDLFQLPPIAQPRAREYLFDRYGGVHFFYAHAYSNANFRFRELTINHRQKEDAAYFELLNRVRDGHVSSNDIDALNERVVQDFSIYDRFTTLLPTKAEAEAINRSRIQQLDSKEYTYQARITYDKHSQKNHDLESLFPIVSTLRLKKGALVMMVSNDIHQRWVNGTLGIVSELSNDRISVAINGVSYEISLKEFTEQEVIYENGKLFYDDVLTVVQYPIVPAYAITIHKSQGKTYNNIVCDIDKCFEDGQAYVALSRCAKLDGLHLTQRISPSSIRVNKGVLDFYRKSLSQPH